MIRKFERINALFIAIVFVITSILGTLTVNGYESPKGFYDNPMELTCNETSDSVNIVSQYTTWFLFTADETNYYYFKFNDGIRFYDENISVENYGDVSYEFINGEYKVQIKKGQILRIGVNPYEDKKQSNPICSSIVCCVRAGEFVEDGITKERAITAKVGTKTEKIARLKMESPVYYRINLKVGLTYRLIAYTNGKLIKEMGDYDCAITPFFAENDKQCTVTWDKDGEYFIPKESGMYYLRFEGSMNNAQMLVKEASYEIDGKVRNLSSISKGSFVNAYEATASNGTKQEISINVDIYGSDGETLLNEQGEPAAVGEKHTYSSKIASGKGGVTDCKASFYSIYQGYTINYEQKSITYKYIKVDGLVRINDNQEQNYQRGQYIDIREDCYINATDYDYTYRAVVYNNREHTEIIANSNGATYTRLIEANTSRALLDELKESEGLPPYGVLYGRVIYLDCEIDDENHTITEYFHTLECEITEEQEGKIEDYMNNLDVKLADFKQKLPEEITIRYADPNEVKLKGYTYKDILNSGVITDECMKNGSINSTSNFKDGRVKVSSRLGIDGIYRDKQCTDSAYNYDDGGVPSGVVYVKFNYINRIYFNTETDLGWKELLEYDLHSDGSIVVKVNLEKSSLVNDNYVDKILFNKISKEKLNFELSDLKGLNAFVNSLSTDSIRLSNIKELVGSNSQYEALVDSGLVIKGGVSEPLWFDSCNSNIIIRGYYDSLMGAGIQSTGYYWDSQNDVYYGTIESSDSNDNPSIRGNIVNCISVNSNSSDKSSAVKERIMNYYRNAKDIDVKVSKLSPIELANILDAGYVDDENDEFKTIKAAYLTKYGLTLYNSTSDTSEKSFVDTLSFSKVFGKTCNIDFSALDNQSQIKYLKYKKYDSEGEVVGTNSVESAATYPMYRIQLTLNGKEFDMIYVVQEAVESQIEELDNDSLLYSQDSTTGVSIKGTDGTIPVDTSVEVEELDNSGYISKNEELNEKDVSVFEISPYSSSEGMMTDLGDSEMEIRIPLDEGTTAEAYCFDEDGMITDEEFDVEYEEDDGKYYATFDTNHFSTYGIAEAKCNHSLSEVSMNKASFTKDGNIKYYICSKCGRYYKDDQANEPIKKSSTVIQKANASLSGYSYIYNGKVKTPSLKVSGLKKGTDYTYTLSSGRKNVGTYKYKVIGKGYYSGTKILTFTIVPKSTYITSISGGKKSFAIKWKKPSSTYLKQTTGYQIRYSQYSSMENSKVITISNKNTISKNQTKLKSKKKYYVQVRTYKTVKGKKYYSSWSKVKSVNTK